MKKIFILGLLTLLSYSSFTQRTDLKESFYSNNKISKGFFFAEGKEPLAKETIITVKELFKLNTEDNILLKNSNIDEIGIQHDRYDRYYKGLLVENSEIIVHSKQNRIISINGDALPINEYDVKPIISPKQSIEIGLLKIKAKKYAWEILELEKELKNDKKNSNATYYPNPQLGIWYHEELLEPILIFKYSIFSVDPFSKVIFYIDAKKGTIINEINELKEANVIGTAVTRYSNTQNLTTESITGGFRLRDYSRGQGIETKDCNTSTSITSAVDYVDVNNTWDEWNNAQMDNVALDAHFAAQRTYDYFKNIHNRNSYDGSNSKIKIYTHYGLTYNNAFWDGSSKYIACGDGDNIDFTPIASVDVIGHEFGHGLTQSFTSLSAWGEPGAIDEGLSDIWSSRVEEYANVQGNQVWINGEDWVITANHRRNASNPNLSHYHVFNTGPEVVYPDTYNGNGWYTGQWDYNGRHINCMVLSYWFFLLSNGGVGLNDLNTHFIVLGIGSNKAAQITYNFYNYITTNTSFDLISTYTKYIASQFYGNNSNEAIQTWNAWYAVGLSPIEAPFLISGDQPVCFPGPTTFSLPNELEGATITWSTSSNIEITGGQGTRVVTVRKNSSSPNGSGTITVVYNHGNGDRTSQKTVWVGYPILYSINGPTSGYTNSQYYYQTNPTMNYNSGSTYTWSLSPSYNNSIYSYNDQVDIFFNYPYTYYNLSVSAQNTCGTAYAYTYIDIQNYQYYSLSPNPATNQVTITVDDKILETTEITEVENTIYTVKIFNIYGILQSNTKHSGRSFTIPINGLKDGNYFVQIDNGKKTESLQLVVKK